MTDVALRQVASVEDVKDRYDAALSAAFRAASAERARPPHAFSMSRLGGCTRAGAYALALTPVSDELPIGENRAANLGTAEHIWLLPYLTGALGSGAAMEQALTLHAAGLVIPGTADVTGLYDLGDQKTVGEHRLHRLRRTGLAFPDHWIQVAGYALARRQSGADVDHLVWIYMDRASGDHETLVEEFTDDTALAVLDRVREIRRWADTDPDRAPRTYYAVPGRGDKPRSLRGPGLEFMCNECPWLRRCWGEDARPNQVGAQRNLARTDPQIEAALVCYDAAAARRSEADKEAEFYSAVLDGRRAGVYGAWSLRWSKGSSVMDAAAVREHYESAGLDLPRKSTSGSMMVRLVSRLSNDQRKQLGLAPVAKTAAVRKPAAQRTAKKAALT